MATLTTGPTTGPTPATMFSAYAEHLRAAHAEALDRLLKIIRTSESEAQVRLAAAAILRLQIPQAPLLEQTQHAAPSVTESRPETRTTLPKPTRCAPLTAGELAELSRLLPHVTPARFTSRHTPDHWRAIIALRHRDAHIPLRGAA